MRAKNTIELVDFLKGFSMFSIVAFHVMKVLPIPYFFIEIMKFGGTGVHVFIFVSGFGLYYSFLRKPMTYVEFIKKRFVKVYIPYIIVVTIIAIISVYIPIFESAWFIYFGHVFLYKMFNEYIMNGYGDQFWFISTIFQFYLTFPLITRLRRVFKSNRWFVIFGFIISLIWIIIVLLLNKESHRTWNGFFLQYLWEFILGMSLADIYLKKGKLIELNNIQLLSIAFAGILIYSMLALKFGDIGKEINDFPALIGFTLLAVVLYNFKWRWINDFFVFVGSFSFSLYLLHILVINLIFYTCANFNLQYNLLACAIALVSSLVLAYYFNLAIVKFYKIMNY